VRSVRGTWMCEGITVGVRGGGTSVRCDIVVEGEEGRTAGSSAHKEEDATEDVVAGRDTGVVVVGVAAKEEEGEEEGEDDDDNDDDGTDNAEAEEDDEAAAAAAAAAADDGEEAPDVEDASSRPAESTGNGKHAEAEAWTE
jgi:hypothetical protein